MLGAVGELDDVLTILHGAKFENARQADNARAVNADEAGRVETLLKRLHGFAQKMNSSARVEFGIVAGSGNPIDIIDRDDLKARAGADGEARDERIGRAIERLSFVRHRRSESARRIGLGLLLGLLDAEVEVAPEVQKNRGFEAGFKQFQGIGSSYEKAAHKERSNSAGQQRPGEGAKLERKPRERTPSERAADGAEDKARGKKAEAHNELVGEEAFEIGIAEFPGLPEVRDHKKEGDEAKAAPANGLQQPEGGETERSAVKHTGILP
jgi:hypothetical protein